MTVPRNVGVHVSVTVEPETCAARLAGADGTASAVAVTRTIATSVASERAVRLEVGAAIVDGYTPGWQTIRQTAITEFG
jgi:hypothetical protein